MTDRDVAWVLRRRATRRKPVPVSVADGVHALFAPLTAAIAELGKAIDKMAERDK
jgi:hypothetical protein